jgi:hypothetical protein
MKMDIMVRQVKNASTFNISIKEISGGKIAAMLYSLVEHNTTIGNELVDALLKALKDSPDEGARSLADMGLKSKE